MTQNTSILAAYNINTGGSREGIKKSMMHTPKILCALHLLILCVEFLLLDVSLLEIH